MGDKERMRSNMQGIKNSVWGSTRLGQFVMSVAPTVFAAEHARKRCGLDVSRHVSTGGHLGWPWHLGNQ